MTYGYLEDGTLIQVGTLLRMGNEIREVTHFISQGMNMSFGRPAHDYMVKTNIPGAGWEDEAEYHKIDLEDMVREKTLRIYN